jgi:hypothetical protein
MINAKLIITSAAALLALTACGGGSDAPPPDDTTVPASAFESPEGFSRYVGGLAASEDKEPLTLTDLVPPTSETGGEIDP